MTFTAITTRREFQVEASTWRHAVIRTEDVLTNEELIIICDSDQTEVNYSDGVVKAER